MRSIHRIYMDTFPCIMPLLLVTTTAITLQTRWVTTTRPCHPLPAVAKNPKRSKAPCLPKNQVNPMLGIIRRNYRPQYGRYGLPLCDCYCKVTPPRRLTNTCLEMMSPFIIIIITVSITTLPATNSNYRYSPHLLSNVHPSIESYK